MNLSKENIKNISPASGVMIPDEKLFTLPEKVLQFGTGVLLRGLPDYFIDKANRAGIFNGRIVMVKSTATGDTDGFSKQDGLFTLCVKGLENGEMKEELIINSSISRVLSARDDWNSILDCADNPDMQIIISNTTEVGITLVEDDVRLFPPISFPGKLLAFLYKRFQAFNGKADSGMVIIPTELIINNGTKLRSILVDLAGLNKLSDPFIHWLQQSNHFCNSLVDRIVPGKLPVQEKTELEKKLGYIDELMIMSENFRLWAIETSNRKVQDILSFSRADAGLVIAPDIEKYRELKLRLLNGTHSFSCGLAFLAGFTTVKDAMADKYFRTFIHELMMQEIVPTVCDEHIPVQEAIDFAEKVMERFSNPALEHSWINISVQYTSKMMGRTIPLLIKYFKQNNHPPEAMAAGFAAYLLFMKCSCKEPGHYTGYANLEDYIVRDDHAGYFAVVWQEEDGDKVVNQVLANQELWGTDLSILEGFADLVKQNLRLLMHNGVMSVIRNWQLNKTVV